MLNLFFLTWVRAQDIFYNTPEDVYNFYKKFHSPNHKANRKKKKKIIHNI